MKKTTLALFLIITFMALGGIGWYYTDYLPNLPKTSLDLPDPDENSDIIIDNISKYDIQQMLSNRDFDTLNKILAKAKKSYENDIAYEDILFDFYEAFECHDNSFASLLSEWKAKYPQKYQPYLASAFYYNYIGWESRNYDWIQDTKKEQIEQMRKYFRMADAEAENALHINSRFFLPYYLQLNMSMAIGDYKTPPIKQLMKIILARYFKKDTDPYVNQTEKAALQKALELAPYSFRIRVQYINSLMPRWGGSHEEMEAFALDSQKYADVNPKIKALQGYSYYDQGNIEKHNQNYPKALEFYKQAISYGDYSRFYSDRAHLLFILNDDASALADIEKAIELRPTNEEYYAVRSMIHFDMGDISQAIYDLQVAQTTKPDDKGLEWARDWVLDKITNEAASFYQTKTYEKAIEKYDLVLSVGVSKYNDLYYWKGCSYMYMKDYKSAAENLQKATELFPNNFDYFKMLDWVLAQSRDWDAIIAAWGRYISYNPKDANAYLERSGAYFYKGDYEATFQDVKKAADLGNAEAKVKYQQLAQKLGK